MKSKVKLPEVKKELIKELGQNELKAVLGGGLKCGKTLMQTTPIKI